jgi:hypothetical protein
MKDGAAHLLHAPADCATQGAHTIIRVNTHMPGRHCCMRDGSTQLLHDDDDTAAADASSSVSDGAPCDQQTQVPFTYRPV